MYTTDFWHKHHIHCRKIILLLLFCIPSLVFSQRNVMENDLKFSRRRYHFGIHLGGGFSDFMIKHNEAFALSDSILSIKSRFGMGFEIGALGSFHVNKYVEFRTLPSFVFANKNITYNFADGTTKQKTIPQIFFEIPVEMKFKTEPLKDIKLYLVAGLKYAYDLGGNFKSRRDPDMPKQSAHDFGVNYGVGMEIHFPLFILSPEFKVFNSVLNIHKQNNDLVYSKYMRGLYNRSFTFSLNFEG
ncbi:MAG: porin family protein [Chitinophagales bacterium]